MESESKVNAVAEVSEQTNQLSVVADSSMNLSESSGAKKEDVKGDADRDDKDKKRRREESRERSVRRSRDRGDRRSRDRSDRRSRRDRSVSKERRRGSADRSKRHDRDRDRERDRDKDKERSNKEKDVESSKDKTDDKDRGAEKEKKDDKERDRESRTSRSDKDRDRDRDRDVRDRDRDRTRSTREDRDRRSRRSRSRTPDRRRGRDSRRRSRSASSGDDRRRNRRKSRSPSPAEKKKSSSSADGEGSTHKPVTLRDIISANPGISVQEAAIRLNAYNTAVARGLTPEPITAPIRGVPGVAPAAVGMVLPGSASSGMLAGLANPLLAGGIGTSAMGGMGLAGEGGAATKAQRELYVGNLPPGITVPQLAEFLNAAFKQLGLSKDTTQNTVITAWVSPESHYAFVELRTIEEATAALTYLNGIQVGMFSLKFGRPKGYTGGASSLAVPMVGATPAFNNPLLTTSMLGTAAGLGASNPLLAGLSGTLGVGGAEALSNTIMVTNLPALISEQQIRELFTPFGELKAFNTIRTTAGSTQSAVFEYVNAALTDGVVTGMNNLDIAGHKLSVQRIPMSSAAVLLQPNAAVPPAPATAPPPPAGPPPSSTSSQPDELAEYPPSAVIRMSNMTTPQDLSDDQSYEELMEDVADECNSHGTVKSIVIPRSGSDSSVGKIFVHFVDVSGAQASRKAVAGRKFNGRVVEAYFYPEELFLKKVYTLPEGYLASGAAPASNGSSNGTHAAGSSASSEGDINDIDEGERPSAQPVEAYDPTASMEDLD